MRGSPVIAPHKLNRPRRPRPRCRPVERQRPRSGGRRRSCWSGSCSTTSAPSLTLLVCGLALIALLLPLFQAPSCPCGPASPVLDRTPWARRGLPLRDGPTVSLRGTHVLVDSTRAGSVVPSLESGTPATIPELVATLERKRALYASFHSHRPIPGFVVMEIAQDAPALSVKALVASAAAAGFEEVDFIVRDWYL